MVNVMLAGAIAMLTSLIGTPLLVRLLVRRSYGQFIHDDLTHHHVKRGKPTMGGLVIICAVLLGYFGSHWAVAGLAAGGVPRLIQTPFTISALLVLFLLLGLGVIGFLDDYIKIHKERSLGLTSRQKLVGQTAITVVFTLGALHLKDAEGRAPASTAISWVRDTGIDLTFAGSTVGIILFVIWSSLLIAGASNGVNITDGLDGLAAGASVMVFGAYTVIGLAQNNTSCDVATGPECYAVSNPLDLAVVACSISGACAGFLWWNAAPAQIIMGDTGSLSLGAALAGLAILTQTQLLLIVLGGLFVAITASVIIQVVSFKTRGKRVFRMAPLHHHFELVGWSEVTIVLRFWLVAGSCVLIGLALFFRG